MTICPHCVAMTVAGIGATNLLGALALYVRSRIQEMTRAPMAARGLVAARARKRRP